MSKISSLFNQSKEGGCMSNVQLDRINKVLSEPSEDMMSPRVIEKLFRMDYKYKVGQKFIYHIDYSDSHPRAGIIIGINPDKRSYVVRWNDGEVSDDFPEYLIEPIEESEPSYVTIKGYISRAENGFLGLYVGCEPLRENVVFGIWDESEVIALDSTMFPNITSNVGFREVEITIKLKKS